MIFLLLGADRPSAGDQSRVGLDLGLVYRARAAKSPAALSAFATHQVPCVGVLADDLTPAGESQAFLDSLVRFKLGHCKPFLSSLWLNAKTPLSL
jgi:hypothetical protein